MRMGVLADGALCGSARALKTFRCRTKDEGDENMPGKRPFLSRDKAPG